jgi:serine/threonine protein kinase
MGGRQTRSLTRMRNGGDGRRIAVLIVELAADPPTPGAPDRHANEYGLKDELSIAWAARPLEVTREQGRTLLVLEDPGGETLGPLLGQRVALESFLPLAIGVAAALAQVHQRGLIHKDIKPANVLVNSVTGQAWLTGFAIASRLQRERQAPTPPEAIAGTRAYMASERTGRMNRSVDSRSDWGHPLRDADGRPPLASTLWVSPRAPHGPGVRFTVPLWQNVSAGEKQRSRPPHSQHAVS